MIRMTRTKRNAIALCLATMEVIRKTLPVSNLAEKQKDVGMKRLPGIERTSLSSPFPEPLDSDGLRSKP